MSAPGPARVALVAGATGLVGREILRQLADEPSFGEVRLLLRRPWTELPLPPKVREVVVDFLAVDGLGAHPAFDGVTHLFCALGTTIRMAGSQAEFRRVDQVLPSLIARAALARGARHLLLVSAVGADARSRVFYSRVKGELEDELCSMGFRSVTIARPSLLLGKRSQRRPGEELGKRIGWLFPGRWRPVEAGSVARALVASARQDAPGVRIIENRELRRSV